MTIYHTLMEMIEVGNSAQIEALRLTLEAASEPLRGDEPPATDPVAETPDFDVLGTVETAFSESVEADGLVKTCVEARRALTDLMGAI